ncbi:MAG: B3/4 domain-containing protein [Thermomicrobiales bacterium]|nr:B3/4 domain-containing protein [Thermomicrobiales bacterium]MCO5217955.1 B3/4 domain-containing protein [Thermomicrobiales bacterium]MCO5224234.1 B3/4 domain-containing protein [Thermomicrobiales bacterium]MCO5229354.1 B3/4 domain-containing protein [Thermomicrobiales bacterium]
MSIFVVEQAFWSIFPTAQIGVLVVHGIDNAPREDVAIQSALAAAHETARAHVPHETWTENDVVKRWRNAFQQFKTKKGARSSIEALLKRVSNGNQIGSINPLVDVYNTISLTYGVPVGGEDLAKINGDVRLTVAAGGESFLPLGAEEDEPALAGEVAYLDDAGAICRCWNWRETVRTMLTEDTTDAIMVLEAVDDSTNDQFWAAVDALAVAIREHLGGTVEIHRVTLDSQTVELPNIG